MRTKKVIVGAYKRTLLTKFEDAVRDMALMGTRPPHEWESIREEYERSRNLLLKHLNK